MAGTDDVKLRHALELIEDTDGELGQITSIGGTTIGVSIEADKRDDLGLQKGTPIMKNWKNDNTLEITFPDR